VAQRIGPADLALLIGAQDGQLDSSEGELSPRASVPEPAPIARAANGRAANGRAAGSKPSPVATAKAASPAPAPAPAPGGKRKANPAAAQQAGPPKVQRVLASPPPAPTPALVEGVRITRVTAVAPPKVEAMEEEEGPAGVPAEEETMEVQLQLSLNLVYRLAQVGLSSALPLRKALVLSEHSADRRGHAARAGVREGRAARTHVQGTESAALLVLIPLV
jgi:hypothetical protein